MRTSVVLTVSESKRLIAKGLAAMPAVQSALSGGTVAVAKGTTNGYLVEELLGKKIDKLHYVTGRTMPRKAAPAQTIDASICQLFDILFVAISSIPLYSRSASAGLVIRTSAKKSSTWL